MGSQSSCSKDEYIGDTLHKPGNKKVNNPKIVIKGYRYRRMKI